MKLAMMAPAAHRAYAVDGGLTADVIAADVVVAAFSDFQLHGAVTPHVDSFLAQNFDGMSPSVHRLGSYFPSPDSRVPFTGGRVYYPIGSISAYMPAGRMRRLTGQFNGVSAAFASGGWIRAKIGDLEIPAYNPTFDGQWKVGAIGCVQLHFTPESDGFQKLVIFMSDRLPGGPIPVGGPTEAATYDSLWLLE